METASVVAEAAKFCNFENEEFVFPASSKSSDGKTKIRRVKFWERAHRPIICLKENPLRILTVRK
jgi:hypothetical protein